MKERDRRCPICGAFCRTVLELSFPEREFLPDRTQLAICQGCNFLFSRPGSQANYDKYYASNKNDIVHDEVDAGKLGAWHSVQAVNFQSMLYISGRRPGANTFSALDFGCGSGALLKRLSASYPGAIFEGFDLNYAREARADDSDPTQLRQAVVTNNIGLLRNGYDFLILSHVLEHIFDFRILEEPLVKLAKRGVLYVEVPDAARYPSFPRREYMYYFDRLHVNHFSTRAICRLLRRYRFKVLKAGQTEIPYKDGDAYPAMYVIASREGLREDLDQREPSLRESFAAYVEAERSKAESMRKRFSRKTGILVYGFGDNFFRCRYAGGPLENISIRAVIDRRWESLRNSRYSSEYSFTGLDEALSRYPDTMVAVTISTGTDEIVDLLMARGVRDIAVL